MKRIHWSPASVIDLEEILAYLSENHPFLAHPTVQKLYDAALSLKRFPYRGRNGATPGTRELVMAPMPYIILDSVTPELVNILRILHTSRKRPT